MTELDLNNLRRFLEEEERFAVSIPLDDPRAGLARQMLGVVSEARRTLAPSADSTANFVAVNDILAELAQLRARLERMPGKKQ